MTSKQINSDPLPDDAPSPGIYKHYKGNLYQVFGLARHSESEEWLVVYQALYGEKGFWVRPLTIWLEPVAKKTEAAHSEVDAGVQRFELVDSNEISLDTLAQRN